MHQSLDGMFDIDQWVPPYLDDPHCRHRERTNIYVGESICDDCGANVTGGWQYE